MAEESNAIAVGVDIDACGLVTLSMHGKKVVPKTVEDLRNLISLYDLDNMQISVFLPKENQKE